MFLTVFSALPAALTVMVCPCEPIATECVCAPIPTVCACAPELAAVPDSEWV